MGELQTIAELYLPELRDEVFALYQASHNPLGEYGKAMAPTKFLEAVHNLRAAARTLLVNIMDVPSDER